jgi:hypothetical protein
LAFICQRFVSSDLELNIVNVVSKVKYTLFVNLKV